VMEITGRSIQDKSVLKLVYDGIETSTGSLLPTPDLRSIFKLPECSVIIGNVAALAPHKDYFTWLDTADILRKKHPEFRFLMIGDGPLREELSAAIRQKNLGDVVTMAGFREDAKTLMQGFDIFLNTSETEGLGSSILDAFVRGIPVVATAAGGIPEIVIHNKTGMLVPVKQPQALADCVEQLLSDPGLKNEITRNASEFVKKFDISVMASQTLEIYREITHQTISFS
jgi:L-malate glycosyltransferase